jgi:DNA-binding CsgD family transcriptional regulator
MGDQLSSVAERDSNGKSSGVEVQVRRLITDLVGEAHPADRAVRRADWVILDVEVDGVRCLLLRVPEASVPLSPRELEIARMVARGYPNKTIASILYISSWTVASHLRRVFSKLGVSTRAAMVARLLEDGQMVDLGESVYVRTSVAGPPRSHRPWPTRLAT